MKLFQNKKVLYFNLFFGLFWLVDGIYKLLSTNLSHWLSFVMIIISFIYLILFFYFLIKPILSIENGQVIYNDPLRSKTFRLDEIVEVKKFAGDITILTKSDKIGLNVQLFGKESLEELNTILNGLDLKK